MTYSLTTDQLSDFRADLDIDVDEVFTDVELNRLYTRVEGDYSKAVALAWGQIAASASKLNDYKAAQSSETLSQIFEHVKYMKREAEANAGMGGAVIAVGNFGLNIDASETNEDEWNIYGDYDGTD